MEQVFMGIDQSLSETGIAILKNKSLEILYSGSIKHKPEKEPIHRMLKIKEDLRSMIKEYEIDQGIMEGFGFGAKGNAIFELGGLGYIIRELFVEEKIPLLIIAPTTLKKYVTGKGNTKKDLMIAKIYQKWGCMFENHNIADAYGLTRLGIDLHYVKSTNDLDFLKRNNLDAKILENHYYQLIP